MSKQYLIHFHVVFCILEKPLILLSCFEHNAFILLLGFRVFLGVFLRVWIDRRSKGLFFKQLHTQSLAEPKTLRHAFMTCYGFETEVLQSVVRHAQKLLLLNDSADGTFELAENFGGHPHFTLIMPSKVHMGYGFGAFPPKLWLVEFEDRTLRVVVGSGNLGVGDWTVWSNCLWFQDFQQKTFAKQLEQQAAPAEAPAEAPSQDFEAYLSHFVNKLFPKGLENLAKFGGISLENYDFRVAVRPVLVGSLPGRHALDGPKPFSFGLERLREIAQKHPPALKVAPAKKRVVYQTSSVGQLSTAFLLRFLGTPG